MTDVCDNGTRFERHPRCLTTKLSINLANFMRALALPVEVEHWSLTSLRGKLAKASAGIVRNGRYVGRGGGAADAVRQVPEPHIG